MTSIPLPLHPIYQKFNAEWGKFRSILTGGQAFIDEYLVRYSDRETDDDFNRRKNVTYCPAHTKASLIEIRNAIAARMLEIKRIGGSRSYTRCVEGLDGGIDHQGRKLNNFLVDDILLELLGMGKVAVCVDKEFVDTSMLSKADNNRIHPYLYRYVAEDIINWSYDDKGVLTDIVLRNFSHRAENGLITDIQEYYTRYQLIGGQVVYTRYDTSVIPGVPLASDKIKSTTQTLNLTMIPVVIFELSESLLTEIANHQITLLNMASGDANYSIYSNFPFYVENADPNVGLSLQLDADGNPVAADPKASMGTFRGKRYSKGMNPPEFINPSSEPLRVSMEKQNQIRDEIKELIGLAITNLRPTRASAESKQKDDRGMEAGLATIGLTLEQGERDIAKCWDQYQGSDNPAVILYPLDFSLRSEDDRLVEAGQLQKLLESIPSITYQREVAKRIVEVSMGQRLTSETLNKCKQEIDKADVINRNPDDIRDDYEAGLVSANTASQLRGYPEGEVEQAKKDHAERAAAIAMYQGDAGARGVADMSADPALDKKMEKKAIKEGV